MEDRSSSCVERDDWKPMETWSIVFASAFRNFRRRANGDNWGDNSPADYTPETDLLSPGP